MKNSNTMHATLNECKVIKVISLIICLIWTNISFSQPTMSNKEVNVKSLAFQNTLMNEKSAPVTIFYGLNESHSNDWAQCSNDGLIGISYYDKLTQNLIFKLIQSDGTENEDIISNGAHLEISVLLFDSNSNPHVFVAHSSDSDQTITHYYKNEFDLWVNELVISFMNEGGKFIYELSADLGPNNSFHLLVLKTHYNPDSDDYYYASEDAHLYYITNTEGSWQKNLIHHYDTIWTLDEYSKALNRQDIKVDKDGFVHVVFGEQIEAASRLCYATNMTGSWVIEIALNYTEGTRDDAGWFPSIGVDNNGIPCISCTNILRVTTGSAMSAKLLFVTRIGEANWNTEMVTESDDGYYGTDGRDYTGGLTHLVFDYDNNPNIIFTDIASRHTGLQNWNLGNIRYAVKQEGIWDISTIYRQPLPTGFFNATEMYGMCLLISDNIDKIQVIGQQIVVNSSDDYSFSLIHSIIKNQTAIEKNADASILLSNTPNPFTNQTEITFTINQSEHVSLSVYNIYGELVEVLLNNRIKAGNHTAKFDGSTHDSGIYFYQFKYGRKVVNKKMLLIK